MQETLLYRIVVGGIFIVVGVVIFFFHEQIIKTWDDENNKLFGDPWWTGKFTQGAKVFVHFFSALVIIYGLLVIFGFFQ